MTQSTKSFLQWFEAPLFWNIPAVFTLIFFIFAIPAVFTDLKKQRLPDIFTITGTVLMLAMRLILKKDFAIALLSSFMAVLLFFAARKITKGGLGEGDIKFAAFCASYSLPFPSMAGFALSALLALLFFASKKTLTWLKSKKKEEKSEINAEKSEKKRGKLPFGPFMLLGQIMSLYIVHSFFNCYNI